MSTKKKLQMIKSVTRRDSLQESLSPTNGTSSTSPRSSPCYSRDHQRQRFYKTRLCPYHFKKGSTCKGADLCSYAHSFQELRPSVDLTKTKLCVDFTNGVCMRSADECPFAHGGVDIRPPGAMGIQDALMISPGDVRILLAHGQLYEDVETPLFGELNLPSNPGCEGVLSGFDEGYYIGPGAVNEVSGNGAQCFLNETGAIDIFNESTSTATASYHQTDEFEAAYLAEDETKVEISLTQLAHIITAARLGRDLSSLVARVLQQGVSSISSNRRGQTY